jgi:apolipoprotein N-acyltransferase
VPLDGPVEADPAKKGVGRLVGAAAAVFVAGVLLARLLVSREGLWPVAVLAFPVVLVLLALAVGLARAVVLLVLFGCTVATFYWVVSSSAAGWTALILGPVVAFASYLALRVALAMLADRRAAREAGKEQAKRE